MLLNIRLWAIKFLDFKLHIYVSICFAATPSRLPHFLVSVPFFNGVSGFPHSLLSPPTFLLSFRIKYFGMCAGRTAPMNIKIFVVSLKSFNWIASVFNTLMTVAQPSSFVLPRPVAHSAFMLVTKLKNQLKSPLVRHNSLKDKIFHNNKKQKQTFWSAFDTFF